MVIDGYPGIRMPSGGSLSFASCVEASGSRSGTKAESGDSCVSCLLFLVRYRPAPISRTHAHTAIPIPIFLLLLFNLLPPYALFQIHFYFQIAHVVFICVVSMCIKYQHEII